MRNLIMICADQWRGDCLGINGNTDVHTPFIDNLGATGINCTNAYAATPTCVPARAALMTGLTQESHRRVGYQDGTPFEFKTTLPSVLRDAGYQTQAVGKMHYYPERNRIGFDNVILHDGYLHHSRKGRKDPRFFDDYLAWLQSKDTSISDYIDSGLECNSFVARPWDKDESLHPTTWVTQQAIEWLYRRDQDQPFFLYVSYHRPHPPYDPPQWAWDLFKDADLAEFGECDWFKDFEAWYTEHDPAALVTDPGSKMRRLAMAGYYASMAHIDMQISRLRQALYEFDVLDDTVLCFTSDHGEMLGQYDLWRKGFPYEGSARIPLLLHGAGIPTRSEDRIVEIRDIMPTLLDAVGVPIPAEVEGRSFLGATTEDDPDQPCWRSALHGEHYLFGQSIQWIRWQDYKYVWFSADGTEQLFNLHEDPTESHNLATDQKFSQWLEAGRNWLIRYLDGREENFVQEGKLVPGQQAACLLREAHPLDPALNY